MQSKKHLLALLLCVVCLAGMLGGCKGDSSSSASEVTVDMEDLKYGATMKDDTETYALPISYDKRFLSEDQLTAITKYYNAILTQDKDAYCAVTVDFYIAYWRDTVYSGVMSTSQLIHRQYRDWEEMTADGCTISMITVDHYISETDSTSNLDQLYTMLNEISGEDFRSTIQDGCYLELSLDLTADGKTSTIEAGLYLIETADGWFICP